MNEKYLSVPEFALRLGISRIAVFKKVKKGQLPAIKIGRNWAVDEKYIAEYKNFSSKKIKNREIKKKVEPKIDLDKKNIEENNISSFVKEKDNLMEEIGWD